MRETNFINQNKQKWREFEEVLEGSHKDPEKLSELFIQVTDDLSFSRTFYPNRSVRVYLNGLAQKVFFSIYRSKKTGKNRLVAFWTDELPLLIYQARKEFRLSFMVFFLAVAIGALSCAMDSGFAEIILGSEYVDMTLENIESGDPMAVYKQKGEFSMSLGITANNLFVAFLTFVMGVFFSIGTVAILNLNGIMLGAFQYFFIEKGLCIDSFLTIWIHGTLEISAIIIAGAAGITMGKGLAFPGTFTRMQSFQQSARRGLKIMIGIAPIIVMAGFIEGFLTRYTQTPGIIRFSFILICLAFVLAYFVWYPVWKFKRQKDKILPLNSLPPSVLPSIDYARIKSTGGIFADTFIFLKKYFNKLAAYSLIASLLYTAIALIFSPEQTISEVFFFPDRLFGTFSVLDQFFIHEKIPFLPLVNILIFSGLIYCTYFYLLRDSKSNTKGNTLLKVAKISVGVTLLYFVFFRSGWHTSFMVLLIFPIILLWIFVLFKEKSHLMQGFGRTFSLLKGTYGNAISLFFVLVLVGILLFSITDTLLLWLFLDLVTWIVDLEKAYMDQFSAALLTATSMFFLYLVFSFVLTGMGLLYFTLLEIQEAPDLHEKLNHFGKVERIRGLEKE